VFDSTYEGKWLEPSRIHKCSSDYQESGRNYFPGATAVVYSRVIEVLDSKNLLVDFSYNGTNAGQPKPISKQDGIFFFNNKFAIETWAMAVKGSPTLKANTGQIYATLGTPLISVQSGSSLTFASVGEGARPALHVMMSDAFSGVKYGTPNGLFFLDNSPDSKQYGLKRVRNTDQFRIRNEMQAGLGFIRPGVTFSIPNKGYCKGGGVHNGRYITEFCTYRFEGDWFAKDPNNSKARTSGGLRVEWIVKSKEEPGNFIELESMKAFRFDDLSFKFLSNITVEIDDPNFTWYHLASQEWSGGTSTGSESTHLLVNGYFIGLNTNGDFWLINGDEDLDGRGFNSHRVSIFDKIPAKGDVVSQDLEDLKKNGLINKLSDTKFKIWGRSVQKGDSLSFAGKNYSIIQTQRKFKMWENFSDQFANPPQRLKRSDIRIIYTEIELDKGISSPLNEIVFKVEDSALPSVLDGMAAGGCSAVWNIGDDAPGHLMYTVYNVNLLMENVNIHGLIRSTPRPLWVDTVQALSGTISSIPVSDLGALIWYTGDKLQLAHVESGIATEAELIVGFSGKAGAFLLSRSL
jgi:hypothetical protein